MFLSPSRTGTNLIQLAKLVRAQIHKAEDLLPRTKHEILAATAAIPALHAKAVDRLANVVRGHHLPRYDLGRTGHNAQLVTEHASTCSRHWPPPQAES